MRGLISVIIPTYRRAQMLREAIQSVLNQKYQNLEIIIIDDCSNDNTAEVVAEFPMVHYFVNEKNCGPAFSRKKGLKNCHGEYVVFIDDDDYYIDNLFFGDAITVFESNQEYHFVAASAKTYNIDCNQYAPMEFNVNGEMDAVDYLAGFNIAYKTPLTFATIFRYSSLVKSGILEMDMLNHMAMIMRPLLDGKVFFLNRVVGIYRVHQNNISNTISPQFLIDNLQEKLTILKLIMKNNLFESYNVWWYEQVKVTVSYYVYESHPSMTDFRKVRKWCEQNSTGNQQVMDLMKQYHAYLIDYRICELKRRVKKVLGIK